MKRDPLFYPLVGLPLVLVAMLVFLPDPKPVEVPQLEVLREDLTLRDGKLYFDGAEQPFNGVMIERYSEGALKSRSTVSAGLLHGVSEGWFDSGQIQVREHFREGVSHGRRTKWFEDGRLMSESTIRNGEHDGVFRRWHENGQLAEEVAMQAGQPDGLSLAYYPSGFVKARVQLAKGKVVEESFWDDGQESASP